MADVRTVMSTGVATLPPTTPLAEAAKEMVRRRIGSILVLDGTMLSGIITERDMLRAAGKAADMAVEPISRWMTADPVTCSPTTGTEAVAERMLSEGFRHLPVVEGGELVGIVSLRDLLSARIGRST